tara:strand:+ start:193 stop:1488 length:1296 start_codon:yes stop_codon:yes gene_type:complete
MTKRYSKYKVLDLWNDQLTLSKIFNICMQSSDTHIIVDATKEASMTDLELWKHPTKLKQLLKEAIAHNEQSGNTVDIVTGNYKLIPEQRVALDVTLEEVEVVRNHERSIKEQKAKGQDYEHEPTYVTGPYELLIKQGFFDNIYTWPTYFLVWNGTKVAASALDKLLRFPDYELDHLFFVKNRVAKVHRMLLLDELAKRGLIEEGTNKFTLVDPHNQQGQILKDIGGHSYTQGRHVYDTEEDLDGNLYSQPPAGYTNSLIDVVSETSLTTHFRTEKCVWPIVYMKLFMIHGPQFINQNLKKYGFELYDEVIDYSFDSIESPRERTIALAEELKRLQEKNLNLEFTYRVCRDKLEHNLKNYLELCYNDIYIPKIIKDLGHNDSVIKQQLIHLPIVNPETGTWKTYVDRDGGNGVIMDVVRNKPYLQQIMGMTK